MPRFLRFLAAPLAVSLLTFAFVACGSEDDGPPGSDAPTTAPGAVRDPARNVPKDQQDKIKVIEAGSDWFVGENNFVFGITNMKNEPQGGVKATVTFYDLKDPANPKPVHTAPAVQSAPGVGKVVLHKHASGDHEHGGQADGRVGYFVPVKFDHAGSWGYAVEAELQDGTKAISSSGFQVFAKPNIPAPGQPAKKSDNLTKNDVAKLSEIDSGDPPNDMHDVKIKDAIAAGRPLVVIFSTPAFCTSQFCGPVNEEVEALRDVYKDKVDFVHIEIYRDFNATPKVMNPTALEWLLWPDGRIIEPVAYAIDKKGVIYDRWEGPVARNIMEPSVKAIADGKTK